MPFEPHIEFNEPAGGDAVIWRYMDLSKFIALLDTSALFFSRIDLLGDPFEGHVTDANLALETTSYAEAEEHLRPLGIHTEQDWVVLREHHKTVRNHIKKLRAVTYVNCWHAQIHESAAMWKLYLKSDEGIAIRSTYRNLIASLNPTEDYRVFIGLVKYIDFQSAIMPFGNVLTPCIHKRLSFEHERDLRCLVWRPDQMHGDELEAKDRESEHPRGLQLPIDVNLLINEIYVAPTAPDWILALVKSICSKYSIEKPVKQSALGAAPMY